MRYFTFITVFILQFNFTNVFSQRIFFEDGSNNPLNQLSKRVYPIGPSYKTYFAIASNDIGPTGNQFDIVVSGLTAADAGKNASIEIYEATTNSPITSYNAVVGIIPNYGIAVRSGVINASNFAATHGYNSYKVWVSIPGTPIIKFDYDILFVERVTSFTPPAGMQFDIHYCDNWFTTPAIMNTYLTDIRNSIEQSWIKQVTQWNLCSGLPVAPGGGTANMPTDNDNIYQIYIHNLHDIHTSFRGDWFSAGYETGDRYIKLDKTLSQLNPTVSQSELLYGIMSHEFLHGIQWSYMPWSNIEAGFPAGTRGTEKLRRDWIIEGQARFLETVFMSDPTYSSTPNGAYVINSLDYNYKSDASRFIDNIYGVAYNYPNLHDAEYQYCIFWRHLYEHHFPTGATVPSKMALLRETLIKQNNINNSDFANIERDIMNVELSAIAGGNFNTFDKALIDFTEKLYFHDQAYDIAANQAILNPHGFPNIWYNPNPAPNDNFYSKITSFNEPVESLNNAVGTSFNRVYDIPSSFGHRAHRFKFNRNAEIKIEFESNPGARPGFGAFNVDCYLLNGVTIEQKQNIVLNATTGAGNITLNVDQPYKQIVVLVTRLDANEGTVNDYPDYKVSLSEVAGTAGTKYSWPTPKKVASKGLFFGGQHTVTGQFSDFRANGGTNEFCKGIEIEASTVPDERNVYALEAGMAYTNPTSTNIGHFRYANLQNVVANGTNVKIGDKIGVIPAGSHMYFMESDLQLNAVGDFTPGKWINPLRSGSLSPYTDNTDPVINSIQLVDASSANIASPLYQKLDIIIDAYDPATRFDGTGDPNLKCGIHKITIRFLDAAGNEIVHSNGDPTKIKYYPGYDATNTKHELPQGINALTHVFHGTSTPSQFVYIATNKPYNATPDQYWNTRQKDGDVYTVDAKIPSEALFKEGSIKIEVTVEDIQGNQTIQSIGI